MWVFGRPLYSSTLYYIHISFFPRLKVTVFHFFERQRESRNEILFFSIYATTAKSVSDARATWCKQQILQHRSKPGKDQFSDGILLTCVFFSTLPILFPSSSITYMSTGNYFSIGRKCTLWADSKIDTLYQPHFID